MQGTVCFNNPGWFWLKVVGFGENIQEIKMPFKNSDWLPSYEELEVPEIGMSAAPLRASAHHFGRYCDTPSKEFMLCDREEKDPRKCLREGKEVTRCAMDFFKKVKANCAQEFTEYWQCLDKSSWDMKYKNCRKTQAVFDTCMQEKLGQERPELGYFSRVRVHSTARPQPTREVPLPEPTPGPEGIDYSQPVPESVKQGTRLPFL